MRQIGSGGPMGIRTPDLALKFYLDPVGIEPTISSLQMRRSTTELQAPIQNF